MESGLPFALPVLNLFQRLPVEDKAGAITYVAVTSVPRQFSSENVMGNDRFHHFNPLEMKMLMVKI